MTLRTTMRFGDFSKNISKPLDRRIKRYPECDKPDRYELEIGTNCGTVPDSAHFYRLTGLDREDIRCLYTCVTRFIENAEDLYNLRLKLRWDREKHNKRIDGEVLMCMENSFELVTEGEELASIEYWDFKGEKLTKEYDARVRSIDGDAGSIDLENGEMLYMDQICVTPDKGKTSNLMFYEQQAQELFDRLMEQRAVCEGITEDLKASDQMDWTGRMNALRSAVTETVNAEVIFA